jgi:FSR family fosmidomycin resistance protein-like MFS transporter
MSKTEMQDDASPVAADPNRARKTLATCGTAHFLHDGLHDALYVLLPLWAQMFGLSLAQVGLLKAVYSGSIALFQVPAGILAERYGERRLLAGGTVIAGIAYMLLGSAGGFAGLLILLALVGLGSGVQHPLSSTLVARAYATGGQRAALGIYNFSGDLGKMALPAAVALIAGAIGWQTSVIAAGAFGAVGGIAIYILLRMLRAGATAQAPENASTGTVATGGGWGIGNRSGFLTISAINIVDTAVIYGFLTFLPFLLIEKGAAVETLGLALALTFGGGAAGKFLCGVLAERIGIIRTAVITIIAKGCFILLLLWLPLAWALALLPLLGAALNGTSSVLYATVAEFVDPERHSRSFGLFYTLGMGAGAVSPALFGVVSDYAGVPTALAIIGSSALFTVPFCFLLRSSIQTPDEPH